MAAFGRFLHRLFLADLRPSVSFSNISLRHTVARAELNQDALIHPSRPWYAALSPPESGAQLSLDECGQPI